jgi:hypothetical protein
LALFQAKLGWYMHIEQETHALVFDLSIDTSKQLQFSDITGTLSSATLKKFKLLPDNISNIASFEVKIDEFDIDWNANNLDARKLQSILPNLGLFVCPCQTLPSNK